jgi:hypothetical protein
VAIKVIPVTDQDREELKQIQREIAFLADCNHPNVVRYLVRGSQLQLKAFPVPAAVCPGSASSNGS